MGKIAVFCAGGSGSNIGAKFADLHDKTNEGFADLLTYFIDTSTSNLPKGIPEDRTYIFKDRDGKLLDGNGKDRKANYEVISESSTISEIIHRFPPQDLNVVLHSGGGGTGSVAGPLLARELIRRGENCIVIMVGSTMSKKDIENTLNTLKTYENLSTKLDFPLSVLYRENSDAFPRSEVDAELNNYIMLLTAFFSGQNQGLDTSDLKNFLRYNVVVPNYKPHLTAIDIFRQHVRIPQDCHAITAVTLTAESTDVKHDVLVDYQVTGIPGEAAFKHIEENMPLHMVTYTGYFGGIVSALQKQLNDHEEKAKRVSSRTIVSSNDKANDDGLIL